ncbi:hypothetical protein EDB84DRAFT_1627447 [Lactarius hengduanensis]|nr:hypothetical protein EDB84DRAFT_1627447 [Lactarius hengduanensis]
MGRNTLRNSGNFQYFSPGLASLRSRDTLTNGHPTHELLDSTTPKPRRKIWLPPLPDVDVKERLRAIGKCKPIPFPLALMISTGCFPQVQGSPKPSAQQLFTFFTTFYVQIRCFTILQRMARADSMTTFLSTLVGGSLQNQMEAKLANMNLKSSGLKSMPSSLTYNISANPNHRRLPFPLSILLIPSVAKRDNSPTQEMSVDEPRPSRPLSTDTLRTMRAPFDLDGLSSVVGDSWATRVNTPLLDMFHKTSMANNNARQTVDLTAAELNDLYCGGEVQAPASSATHPRVTLLASPPTPTVARPIAVYGDDVNLISIVFKVALRAACGMVAAVLGLVLKPNTPPELSNTSGHFSGSDDGSNAMATTHQQAALAGLGMAPAGWRLPADARPACVGPVPVIKGGGRPSEKDEKDFDPVVLNDVAAHAPAAQIYAEILGHDMKEQALEAQGVAVLVSSCV